MSNYDTRFYLLYITINYYRLTVLIILLTPNSFTNLRNISYIYLYKFSTIQKLVKPIPIPRRRIK